MNTIQAGEAGYVTMKNFVATLVSVSLAICGGLSAVGAFVLQQHSLHPHVQSADRDDIASVNTQLSEIKMEQREQRRDIRELIERLPGP